MPKYGTMNRPELMALLSRQGGYSPQLSGHLYVGKRWGVWELEPHPISQNTRPQPAVSRRQKWGIHWLQYITFPTFSPQQNALFKIKRGPPIGN